MLTGDIRNQIDRIWDAFWSGGISNPLEVIEQITYLLFLGGWMTSRRWRRTNPPGLGSRSSAVSSRRATTPAAALRRTPLVALQARRAGARCSRSSASTFFRSSHPGRRRLHLRPPHEGRPLHHPHAGAASEGGGPAGPRADGGPRHQGRHLRVHARQDRQRRAERPVPHAAAHHPADGGADGAAADRRRLRPGLRHLRLPGGGGRVPARAASRKCCATPGCASTSTTACSTASTSTTPCCASAA